MQIAGVATLASATVTAPEFVLLHPAGAPLDYSGGGGSLLTPMGDLNAAAVVRDNTTLLSLWVCHLPAVACCGGQLAPAA